MTLDRTTLNTQQATLYTLSRVAKTVGNFRLRFRQGKSHRAAGGFTAAVGGHWLTRHSLDGSTAHLSIKVRASH